MTKLDKESVTGISALLVHAANIDEKYSQKERDLVKNFIRSYLNDDTDKILKKAAVYVKTADDNKKRKKIKSAVTSDRY